MPWGVAVKRGRVIFENYFIIAFLQYNYLHTSWAMSYFY
jgi:hypothetical protein